MGPRARNKRKPPKADVFRSLDKAEQEIDDLAPEPTTKQPKVVPSITKGVSVPRKPRVGDDFQATLPEPIPAAPKPAATKQPAQQ